MLSVDSVNSDSTVTNCNARIRQQLWAVAVPTSVGAWVVGGCVCGVLLRFLKTIILHRRRHADGPVWESVGKVKWVERVTG